MFETISPEFLSGATSDYVEDENPDMLARWDRHRAWWEGRLLAGIDSYSRSTRSRIATETETASRNGQLYTGVNFASQDYLGLASHPRVCAVAKAAVDSFGVHSAGSAALMGNTLPLENLERQLADFLGYSTCTVFATGWGAGYGAISALTRPGDHILIDLLAHACLQEGARNATRHVHAFPHLSHEAVERRLERIHREYPRAGILVVTETVFSMDSDVPDLQRMHALCRRYGATLFVDVAHDLGAIGPAGRGFLELQGLLGVVDVVMGSFSKSFASNGGFVASNAPGLKMALRSFAGPLTFTNALSPVQAAIVSSAIDVIISDEGSVLRKQLMANILRMRAGLERAGFRVLGRPSAIVPVMLGDSALSRLMTRYSLEGGGIVNLVEFPAVSRNTCRWRIQVMATHSFAQIDRFIEIASSARERAVAHVEALQLAASPAKADASMLTAD